MKRTHYKITLVCTLVIGFTSCIFPNSVPSLFPQPTPTATVDISSPDYMAGCYLLNPVQLQEQSGFRGIYPGETNEAEVRNILGKPNSVFTEPNGTPLLIYDGFEIALQDHIVENIYDNSQTHLLTNIIPKYGCPEFILTGLNPEMIPLTLMVYLKMGMFMQVFEFPLTLESSLAFRYFQPTTMEKFMKSGYVEYITDIKVVSWNDALK